MFVLRNGLIHTEAGLLQQHGLLIDKGRIVAIRPLSEFSPELPTYDLQGQHLSAGFIDLQLNGCGGVMFNDAPTRETLAVMQAATLRSGTAS